ncbi:MAG TPA: hypothetical protein VN515_05665 [Terriglobales bacterium]|nr:hypothetical protein [Terriglobales bacterium]
MSSTLKLVVVTPQRQVLDTDAQWVDIPAASGAMRALPRHAPTLGVLGAGAVRYAAAAGEHEVAVSGGFFEVLGDRVTVLADSTQS